MLARHVRVLVHPARRGAAALGRARRQPPEHIKLDWTDCTSPSHFQDQVRALQHDDYDALALTGGDAALSLALNALDAINRVPLALLPGGGDHDFARDLGIPRRLSEALQLLEFGQPQRVDVIRATWPGRPDARRLCSAAVIGAAERAAAWRQRVPGSFARLAWIPVCLGARPQLLRVTWQGGSFEGEALLVAVTNTRGQAGGLPLCPRARLRDGLLDLCIVKWAHPIRLLSRLSNFWHGTHERLPEVIATQTRWVRLESLGAELPLAFDGEPVSATTPVELHCEPGAVQIVTPQMQAELAALSPLPQALPAFEAGLLLFKSRTPPVATPARRAPATVT